MFLTRNSVQPIGPVAAVLLVASSSTSFAAQANFFDLGSLLQIPGVTVNSEAFDISADGYTVVGQSLDLVGGVGQDMAFRWRAGVGMQALGHPAGAASSKAYRVSPDGSRVGGSYLQGSASAPRAFTWSSGAGSASFAPIGLGTSPYEPIVAIGNGEAFVVGLSLTGAIHWTPAGGATEISPLPGYSQFLPSAASNDGRAVAGTVASIFGFSRAVLWREGVGLVELPRLAGYTDARGTGISGDGETVIGTCIDASGTVNRGFLWTQAAGLTDLGEGVPVDVNHDGTVVVFEGSPARMWTPARGMQDVRAVLTAAGAIVPPRPFEVRAISGTGQAIVGWVSTPVLGTSRHAFVAYFEYGDPGAIGSNYCAGAVPNSTGQVGTIQALGSPLVSDNDCVVLARQLPQQTIAYFTASRTQGFVSNPAGSAGHLCLGGTISRFSQFAQNTGNVGAILGVVDVVHIPSPTGTIAIAPGETWNFQAWHRDGASSNFTDAVAVTFE